MTSARMRRLALAFQCRTRFLAANIRRPGGWLLGIGLFTACLIVRAETDWPSPNLPSDLPTFGIGQQITLNGLPMRLQGFASPLPPQTLLKQFRRSLGEPLVESTSGARQILGRAEGTFYITVAVSAAGTGSRGTVAVTDLAGMAHGIDAQRASRAHWQDRLPAGSVIASDMASQDAAKAARHLVIVNAHGEAVNRDALLRLMQSDGYRLEREAAPDAAARASLPMQFGGATALYFNGPGKEAVAVIARTGDKTAIVLNTVTTLQAFR
jgi:hypothetical protein